MGILLDKAEQFFPKCNMKQDLSNVVDRLWNKYTESQKAFESQRLSPSEGGHISSFLSQDVAFYESKWLHDVLDGTEEDAYKRMTGKRVMESPHTSYATPHVHMSLFCDGASTSTLVHRQSRLCGDAPTNKEQANPPEEQNEGEIIHVQNKQSSIRLGVVKVNKREQRPKRIPKSLPPIFRSPYLAHYSHLLEKGL